MTALRMRARDFLTEDQLIAIRRRSTWKGAALIVHAWALILGSIALVAWWPNPLIYLLAVGIIGSRRRAGSSASCARPNAWRERRVSDRRPASRSRVGRTF